ncbi:MAG: type III polyketide synthase [Chryseolinea sp.]
MSYITAIGTANPPYRYEQSQIADFMTRAMRLDSRDSRKLRTIFQASGIEYRYSVLKDYGQKSGYTFFPDNDDLEPFPSTATRLTLFRHHALKLCVESVENMVRDAPHIKLEDITHLVTVTCTGLYAPGLDIELVRQLGLRSTVSRTAINFMGCYAAVNAIKVADAFCRQHADVKVLVVCTELCSLHFQKVPTEDNLISNALFSDGSAALLIESTSAAARRLVPEAFCNDLIPAASEDMAWSVGDTGFEMKLSSYVPSLIKSGIASLANKLLGGYDKENSDLHHFAIHPGGRKILENVELELGLSRGQSEAAYHVLRNFGNMSSATIIFVIDRIFKGLTVNNNGESILGLAFGPGLTLESMLLRTEIDA